MLLALLAPTVHGCAEEPLPDRGLRRDDCLRDLRLANLNERLQQCNAVIEAFPRDPSPRNDRYLLHSLAGNDTEACRDLRKAVELAKALPTSQVDAQLRSDLQVRQQLCDGRPAAG